jgi:hypothetical protein
MKKVTQIELCAYIESLRKGTISNKDFDVFKRVVSKRVKIRGDVKNDVVMIAIEKMMISKVEIRSYNVNLFIRQRITDAYYRAGIANTNERKIPKNRRIKIENVSYEFIIEFRDEHWQKQYTDAEKRAEFHQAFFKKSNYNTQFKAGGELFPASPKI